MNGSGQPGLGKGLRAWWASRGLGEVRFTWYEPTPYVWIVFKADWRRIRTPRLRVLLWSFPVLLGLTSLLGNRLAGEPPDWTRAVVGAAGVPLLVSLNLMLTLVPGFHGVRVADRGVSWWGGRHCRRWAEFRKFAIVPSGRFTVLALDRVAPGRPVFLGLAASVPVESLAAFLRSRGLPGPDEPAGLVDAVPPPPHSDGAT